MNKIELDDFYNDGFGWICRHCERQSNERETDAKPNHSRLMREGEAESNQPHFSNRALAKWADRERTTLICPGCGIVEPVDKF